MTFFANSGVAWPKVEHETSQAGAEALSAASDIFSALAKIERGEDTDVAFPTTMSDAGIKLQRAIDIYKHILLTFGDRVLPPLSPAEYELASIEPYWTYDELWRPDLGLNTAHQLYSELIMRLTAVRSRALHFPTNKPKYDVAINAFELMLEWEKAARLARVISVFNRRFS